MAEQAKSDMLMKFWDEKGKTLDCECALDKDKDDTFLTDFHPQTYQDYSDYFEVLNFNFDVKLRDDEGGKSQTETGAGATANNKANGQPNGKKSRLSGSYVSWRSAKNEDLKNIRYPFEFDEFEFERLIDAASPIFFKYCCTTRTFQKAVLVKRVSVGGDVRARGFLKIEFNRVLITKLDWTDGDLTKEKCSFICDKFVITYRQQAASGRLSRGDAPAQWKWEDSAGLSKSENG